MPPLEIVVPIAVPAEDTTSEALFETTTPWTVCPDSTSSMPPFETTAVAPAAIIAPLTKPASIKWPPLETVALSAVPPKATSRVAPLLTA